MTQAKFLGAAVALALVQHALAANDLLTRAIQGAAAIKWNQPQEPVRIYGETYYVGVAGLSSVLIHTEKGLILLDGDLPQSVPLIEANIRKLGFRVEDVKYILNSHAHFDHAGGIAALARDSGAVVVASPRSAEGLRLGHATADDPQAGYADLAREDPAIFPAVTSAIREVHDGEELRLGATRITAHFTPGHTPGATTWTWQQCVSNQCLHIVYADSLNAIAAPGFHFLADTTHADRTEDFRKSIHTVADLPCDVLISVHPDLADVPEKLASAVRGATPNPFIDPQACRKYAQDAEQLLDARISQERKAAH